jgi:hypothetical protein
MLIFCFAEHNPIEKLFQQFMEGNYSFDVLEDGRFCAGGFEVHEVMEFIKSFREDLRDLERQRGIR